MRSIIAALKEYSHPMKELGSPLQFLVVVVNSFAF
jgi:hypothetical protein